MFRRLLVSISALLISISAARALPTAELNLVGVEEYSGGARYHLSVSNWREFRPRLFRAAPNLPPCGTNTSASRTWISIHDAATRRRLYGFCAIARPRELQRLWFVAPENLPTPRAVYIEITDRRRSRTTRSNRVRLRRGFDAPQMDDRIAEEHADRGPTPEEREMIASIREVREFREGVRELIENGYLPMLQTEVIEAGVTLYNDMCDPSCESEWCAPMYNEIGGAIEEFNMSHLEIVNYCE